MEARRKNRVFEDDPEGSASDEDVMPKKKSLATGLLDKLNFDNIPDDIPLGFQPIGMPANPFADKINGDDSNSDTEAQNIKISDYNDIFKQVEKDLGVKYSGNGSSEEITNSSQTREKISFPLVPGQAVATLEELVVDLEKARSSQNHKLIVSL